MTRQVLVTGMAAIVAVMTLEAQSAPSLAKTETSRNGVVDRPSNASPSIVLPRELELEEQLQLRTDERNFAMNASDEKEVQVRQLRVIVAELLQAMRADRMQAAADQRDAVSRKLVAHLGGDWAKGDRWDWATRSLMKPDGSTVPLVPPAPPAKPEGLK